MFCSGSAGHYFLSLYLHRTDTHLHKHTHTHTRSQSAVHRDTQAYRLCDSRSTLHSDGADVVQAAVVDVAALTGELQTLALEMFLLKHSDLHIGGDKGGGMRMGGRLYMCICVCVNYLKERGCTHVREVHG